MIRVRYGYPAAASIMEYHEYNVRICLALLYPLQALKPTHSPAFPQREERITAKPRGDSQSKAQLVLSNGGGDDLLTVNKPLQNPSARG